MRPKLASASLRFNVCFSGGTSREQLLSGAVERMASQLPSGPDHAAHGSAATATLAESVSAPTHTGSPPRAHGRFRSAIPGAIAVHGACNA